MSTEIQLPAQDASIIMLAVEGKPTGDEREKLIKRVSPDSGLIIRYLLGEHVELPVNLREIADQIRIWLKPAAI